MAKKYAPELDPDLQQPTTEEPSGTQQKVDPDRLDRHFLNFREKMKYDAAGEKEKLSDMNTRQKVSYFFTYYKWHVILTFLAIFCIVSITRGIYKNTRPTLISIAIINNTSEQYSDDAFEQSYRSAVNAPASYRFNIESDYKIDPDTTDSEFKSAGESQMTDHEMLSVKSFNGFFDIILCDEKALTYCSEQDVVYPLDVYFPQDIQDALSDRTVTAKDVDGNTRPYALDISDLPAVKDLNLSYDKVYLTFAGAKTDSYSRAVTFLNYLMGTDFSTIDTTVGSQ